jgi:hypothetical protein
MRGRRWSTIAAAAAVAAGIAVLACPVAASAVSPSPSATVTAPATVASPAPLPLPTPATATPGPTPSPGPDAVPSTGATPAPPPDDGSTDGSGSSEGEGLLRRAIDGWLRAVVTASIDPILSMLDALAFTTPDITGPGQVRDLWLVGLGIADTSFVLFVLMGGVVVMTHETLQTRYTIKDIAPRLVVGFIAANMSLAVIGTGITLGNALSGAFLSAGAGPGTLVATIRSILAAALSSGGTFLLLLGLLIPVLGVVLLLVNLARLVVLLVITVAAPLALACHALPQTEAMARTWWRALVACLLVPVGQSIVLVLALRVVFDAGVRGTLGLASTGSTLDFLLVICLLWVLIRIPTYAHRSVHLSGGHRNLVLSTLKYAVVYQLLRRPITAAIRGGVSRMLGRGGGGRGRGSGGGSGGGGSRGGTRATP